MHTVTVTFLVMQNYVAMHLIQNLFCIYYLHSTIHNQILSVKSCLDYVILLSFFHWVWKLRIQRICHEFQNEVDLSLVLQHLQRN